MCNNKEELTEISPFTTDLDSLNEIHVQNLNVMNLKLDTQIAEMRRLITEMQNKCAQYCRW